MRRCHGTAGASGPPRSSPSPLLPLLLLLLMLAADGALCLNRPVRVPRRLLPPEYEVRLQVLKLALALDEDWSAVWSEKLVAGPVAERHPDPTFCMRVIPEGLPPTGGGSGAGPDAEKAAEGDGEKKEEKKKKKKKKDKGDDDGGGSGGDDNGVAPVDTYAAVRKIVDYCSFSGSYLKFGLGLVAASVQCLFNRFARIDLSAVSALIESADDGLHRYLRDLVRDYQTIADKLAVVGASLRHLVQLVTFFDDVEKESIKLAAASAGHHELSDFHSEVKDVATKLDDRLRVEFERACAVDETDWYDKDTRETVSLKVFKDKNKKDKDKEKKKKKKKKKKDKKDEGEDEDVEGSEDEKKKGKKKKDDKNDENEENKDEEGDHKKEKKDKGKDKEKKEKKDKDKDEDKKEKKDKDKDEDKKEKKDKDKDKDKKDKKDKGKDKEKSPETLLERANELRLLMFRVFERLLIRELPADMWDEIFTKNILMKTTDIKKVKTVAPKKKAKETLVFDLDL